LQKKNIRIVLIGPKPQLDYDISGCFLRPFRQGRASCLLKGSEVEEQERLANALIESVLIEYPEVSFVNHNDMFKINNETYSFIKDNLPLLRDGKDSSHLSEFGSNVFSGYLESSYLKAKAGY
jgi:hypothetical protein